LIYWLASRFYLSFLQEFIIFVCFIFLLIVDQRKKEKRNQQQKKRKKPQKFQPGSIPQIGDAARKRTGGVIVAHLAGRQRTA